MRETAGYGPHIRWSKAPFRFLDLQLELCLHILQYTDLITPQRHIATRLGRLEAVRKGRPRYGPRPTEEVNDLETSFPDWQPPTALLLVSHAFSGLAQAVFFSHNHFELCHSDVHEDAATRKAIEGIWFKDESQAATFLSRPVTSSYLPKLASLKIRWPYTWSENVGKSKALQQWRRVLQRFEGTLKPRRLIIDLHGDNSLPVFREMSELFVEEVGSRRRDIPLDFFDRADAMDFVRQSVDMFWPLERLAQTNDVQVFLCGFIRGFDGAKIVYYCRHQSEPLPSTLGDLRLVEPLANRTDGLKFAEKYGYPDLHIQRAYRAQNSGDAKDEVRRGWIEGIFVRPAPEYKQHEYST